ncbi:MAG TPA: hypothetical protein VJI46_00200, partial [Candidatus Nanoarchaeia archaeon]|nr:hypothetical protein [Candidatus Nanoarchaeia archaeon]
RAGIFTEDLTAGDAQSFEHNSNYDFAWVGEGENRRKVYVDIDHLFRLEKRLYGRNPKRKYFLNRHLIKL